MIVKLSDFETYRPKLIQYAEGLFRTRGSANHKPGEIHHLVQEVVQNSLIVFYNRLNKVEIDNEDHLFNYLKVILYYQYKEFTNPNLKNNIIRSICTSYETDSNLIDKFFNYSIVDGEDDLDVRFRKSLNKRQLEIVNLLMIGYQKIEIAAKYGISKQAIDSTMKYIKNKYVKYGNTL
jgi:hypothetical protein